MTDVRLDRAQQQRPFVRPFLPVCRQQRLRLDRIAQRRTRAVSVDRVDLGRLQARRGECLPDDPLLGRTVRRRQAVGGTVLVDGGTPDDGQDLVAVAPRIGQPLQEQHPDALAPARAVRRVGEGLAAAVGSQRSLPAELHERRRRRHDGHSAGQRQRALPRPQGLRRQVQGDE